MKTKLTTIIVLLITGISSLSAQTLSWAKSLGGSDPYDYGKTALDASGNVYITGSFKGTVDFDPGAGTNYLTANTTSLFIEKLDANGNFLWAQKVEGSSSTFASDIKLDNLGNIYVTGYFYGTVDFDPGSGTANLTDPGNADAYVLKLDSNGNFVWAKRMGGTAMALGNALSIDSQENIYLLGEYEGTGDFDPGIAVENLTVVGDRDIFMQKLDRNGNLLWLKTVGGSGIDVGRAITTNAGNVFICGGWESGTTIDFNPGLGVSNSTAVGFADFFILKLNMFSGNFSWVKPFVGSSANDFGDIYGISISSQGNIYTAGRFAGTIDFDPNASVFNINTGITGPDIFVQKLDANGNFVWAKSFGAAEDDGAYTITVDNGENCYVSGDFYATVDFDPGVGIANLTAMNSNTYSDAFVLKLDALGNFVWAKNMGAVGNRTYGNTVRIDALQNVYLSGGFEGTVDFDPGVGTSSLTSNGGSDIFILKLNQNTSTTISENIMGAITLYPNPTTGSFSINFDKTQDVTITIKNIVGQTISSNSYNAITQASINIEATSGLYFVEIQNQITGEVSVLKVQKN